MVREAGSGAGQYPSTAARRAARRIAGEACEKALHRCKQEVFELKQDVEAYRVAFAAILEGGIIQKPVVDRLAAVAPALAALCKGSRPTHDIVLKRNVSLHAKELPAIGAPLSAWRRAQRGQRLGTRSGNEQGDQGVDAETKWWAAQHATRIQAAKLAADRNAQQQKQPTIEAHVPEEVDVEKQEEQTTVRSGIFPPVLQDTQSTGNTEGKDTEETTDKVDVKKPTFADKEANIYDKLKAAVHTAGFTVEMAQLLQKTDTALALGEVPGEGNARTGEWKPPAEVVQRLQQMMDQDAEPNLTQNTAAASGNWHAGDQAGPSVQPVPHWQDALPSTEQGTTWACRQKAWDNLRVEESTDEEDATQIRRRQKLQQLRDQEYRNRMKQEAKERLRLQRQEEMSKPTDALAAAAAKASEGIKASTPEPAADCKQS